MLKKKGPVSYQSPIKRRVCVLKKRTSLLQITYKKSSWCVKKEKYDQFFNNHKYTVKLVCKRKKKRPVCYQSPIKSQVRVLKKRNSLLPITSKKSSSCVKKEKKDQFVTNNL